MSIAYGEKSVTPGQPTVYNVSSNIGWVVIENESPYTLMCNIDGTGSTRTIAAQCIDKIPIPTQGFSGNIILTPLVILSNAAGAPSYATLLDAYGQNEEPTGNYPTALPRAVQVGGSISTMSTTAAQLKNDSNPPNTNIIEVTPSDAGSSTWAADNEGNLVIKGNSGGILTTLLQLIAGATPGVKLGQAGSALTETLDGLKVDGALTVVGSSSLDNGALTTDGLGHLIFNNNISVRWKDTTGTAHATIYVDAANILHISNGTANADIQLLDMDTTLLAKFNTAGFTLGGGNIFLPNPSFQTLVTGNTITIPGVYIRVSSAAAVTGIIMTQGVNGQICFLSNEGSNLITFAAAGSNVRNGSSVTLSGGRMMTLVYQGTQWSASANG